MPMMLSATSLSELASDEHAVSSVESLPSDAGPASGEDVLDQDSSEEHLKSPLQFACSVCVRSQAKTMATFYEGHLPVRNSECWYVRCSPSQLFLQMFLNQDQSQLICAFIVVFLGILVGLLSSLGEIFHNSSAQQDRDLYFLRTSARQEQEAAP